MITLIVYISIFTLSGLSIVLPNTFLNTLEYQKEAITHFEYWRLWTAHLVHLNWLHVILNLISLFFIQKMFRLKTASLIQIALITLPLISVLTYSLHSELSWFNGLSGFNHALLTSLLIFKFTKRPQLSTVILLILIYLKLILENKEHSFTSSWLDIPIATTIHQIGVIAGITLSVIFLLKKWVTIQIEKIKSNQMKSLRN